MARRRSNASKPTYKMVNIDFNDNQKRSISDWIENNPLSLSDDLLAIADGEYKVSFSRDDYHDCYISSLTSKKKPSGSNVISVYLLRHGDLSRLCSITRYFFTEMLNSGDTEYEPETGEYDW